MLRLVLIRPCKAILLQSPEFAFFFLVNQSDLVGGVIPAQAGIHWAGDPVFEFVLLKVKMDRG